MRLVRGLVLCLLPSIAAAQTLQPPVQVELLHAFRAAPGNPVGGLARAADGSFYGLTARLLYRLQTDGTLTVAHTFDPSFEGFGAPTIGPDGVVYGTVVQAERVSVFRFEPTTPAFRILHTFDAGGDGYMTSNRQWRGHALAFGPDGLLYGTTFGSIEGATPVRDGTIYRVDPVTGTAATVHVFSGAAPALLNPVGGLVELGGQLYGVARSGGTPHAVASMRGQGGVYRLDPATGTVTTLHLLSGGPGRNPEVGLTRTSDGWLYGISYINPPEPNSVSSAVHAFRFNPAGGPIEVVPEPMNLLSQLVEAGDGHLYGVTDHNPTIFRVRRQPGGSHSVETVRPFVAGDGNDAAREARAVGLDGLVYGTAAIEGPHRAGAAFRFDPLAGGGVGNPSQFAIVQPFYQNQHNWLPSVPVRAPNGDLYGTTSRGGITLRGAVYRIDGITGAVSIVGPMPGTPDPRFANAISNSDLVVGPDGLLYGTSLVDDGVVGEGQIVRVNPANGTITTALMGAPSGGLTRGPDGLLYGSGPTSVSRFDPATSQWTFIAARVSRGSLAESSRPVLGADNQLYLTLGSFSVIGSTTPSTMELVRVDIGSGTLVTVAGPDNLPKQGPAARIPDKMDTPIAAANGTILVPADVYPSGRSLIEVSPTTGGVRLVCPGLGRLAANGLDGAFYGVDGPLRRCDAATGATNWQALPRSLGASRQAPALVGGVLYVATAGGLYGGGTLYRLNPNGPPALDSDGDGLTNAFETTYGLDPFATTDGNGAADDPDGDGRTNAQEQAEGTHPHGVSARYFAEGATGPFFQTRVDLANPNAHQAIVQVRFQTDSGARVARSYVVPGGSHLSIDPAGIPELEHASFSTVVEADETIALDRTMTWDPASRYGSSIETGVVAPATTWYLAEGATSGAFSLFYLLQNPQATAVTATVRYLRPSGLAPIEKTYVLPPNSRTTIAVDNEAPALAATDVSAVITAPSPIVVERAMYYSQPGQPFAAGHASAGVTAPALNWFLAEGATGAFFDLFVLIENPNASAANVEIEYLLIGGGSLTKTYTVNGNSRRTIFVDDEELPAGSGTHPFTNAALSMTVRSTNAVPIVVERTMWWPGFTVTPNFWYEAHNSPGATTTATRWVVAGGDVGGPDGAQTYVLVANPGMIAGSARVTLLTDSGPADFKASVPLPAKSRTNVPIELQSLTAGVVGVLVESTGATPVPIVVERATYSSPGGVLWAAGGAALAAPLP